MAGGRGRPKDTWWKLRRGSTRWQSSRVVPVRIRRGDREYLLRGQRPRQHGAGTGPRNRNSIERNTWGAAVVAVFWLSWSLRTFLREEKKVIVGETKTQEVSQTWDFYQSKRRIESKDVCEKRELKKKKETGKQRWAATRNLQIS